MRLLVIALALLVLAGAGCKKDTAEKTAQAREPGAVGQNAPLPLDPNANASPEELKRLEDQKHKDMMNRAGISPEQEKQVRDLIVKLAPEYGLKYDAKAQKLQPKDPGQPPFSLDQVIMITVQKLIENPTGTPEAAVRAILDQIAKSQMVAPAPAPNPPPAEAAPPTATEGQSGQLPPPAQAGVSPVTPNSGVPKAPAGEPAYIKAPDVTGEWRSIREEHERHTYAHDDKWYEFMQLFWQDPKSRTQAEAIFHTYRDGKLFSNDTFYYVYNPATAVLQLLNQKTGDVMDQYECFMREGDDKTLYLRSMDPANPKITVYKYVSRGNKPATKEEEAEYKKVTDMIKRGEKPPKDPSKIK